MFYKVKYQFYLKRLNLLFQLLAMKKASFDNQKIKLRYQMDLNSRKVLGDPYFQYEYFKKLILFKKFIFSKVYADLQFQFNLNISYFYFQADLKFSFSSILKFKILYYSMQHFCSIMLLDKDLFSDFNLALMLFAAFTILCSIYFTLFGLN